MILGSQWQRHMPRIDTVEREPAVSAWLATTLPNKKRRQQLSEFYFILKQKRTFLN